MTIHIKKCKAITNTVAVVDIKQEPKVKEAVKPMVKEVVKEEVKPKPKAKPKENQNPVSQPVNPEPAPVSVNPREAKALNTIMKYQLLAEQALP